MSSALISKKRILLCLMLFVLALPNLHASSSEVNGLPNPSTRTQYSSSSWFASADFLAWFPSEEVTSIWADVINEGDNTSTWGYPGFDLKWGYGFRVGLGYNLIYDQWDTSLSWTSFHSNTRHTLSAKPSTVIQPEFFAAWLSGNWSESISAKWGIFFNMLDWELGRSYWISKDFSLRPFLGIKGGWIHQSIHVQYHRLILDYTIHTNNSGKEHVKNNFAGIGPEAGFNSKWRVFNFGSHFLNLFGDFSLAGLCGSWTVGDSYNNTLNKTCSVNTKKNTLGAFTFRGFLGLGWDVDINSGRSHFAAQLGYEMQLWLNQLRIATFQLQRLHGDLTLQGITLDCRFDF
ncbi:MAG: Lpg1974 family pore-forming outer membrane protein [Chlamydiota bacterium]